MVKVRVKRRSGQHRGNLGFLASWIRVGDTRGHGNQPQRREHAHRGPALRDIDITSRSVFTKPPWREPRHPSRTAAGDWKSRRSGYPCREASDERTSDVAPNARGGPITNNLYDLFVDPGTVLSSKTPH